MQSKNQPHGVFQYLDCSTGHITRETMKMLEAGDNQRLWNTVAPYEYGAFVGVPSFEGASEDQFASFPKDLMEVLKFAAQRDCQIVRFDADGFDHDELPRYEW